MPLIPSEALPHFENMIYLPMIITILERDRETIEISPFKLKGPYINIVENTLKLARVKLKETTTYAQNKNLKLIKKGKDGTFTEYLFIHGGHEDSWPYTRTVFNNQIWIFQKVYFAKNGN